MPRSCTICVHEEREAIDRELIRGRPIRRIAAQCAVTEQALAATRPSIFPPSS